MLKKILLLTSLVTVLTACNPPVQNGGGNVESWLRGRANQIGLTLKWNMKADYNISDQDIARLQNVPLGVVIPALQKSMSMSNLNKQIQWPATHNQQPYPFKIFTMAALCKTELVFVEASEPVEFLQKLQNGQYGDCKPITSSLGATSVSPPNSSVQK